MATIKKVLSNIKQTLTENEKKQARDNIDAPAKSDLNSLATTSYVDSSISRYNSQLNSNILTPIRQDISTADSKAQAALNALGNMGSKLTGNTIGSNWTKVSADNDVWTKVKNSSSSATLKIYARPTILSFILNIDASNFTGTSRTISIKISDGTNDFGFRGNIMILPRTALSIANNLDE